MSKKSLAVIVGSLSLFVVGCGQPGAAPVTKTPGIKSSSPPKTDLVLVEQPADAKPVGDVRESAEEGFEVSILGRIGGSPNPWVDGRAAFTIVDPKLEPCKPEEGCPTPWDYCCSTDLLPKNQALIKFVDAAGDTVEQDARQLLGVKELQTVVIKGKAKRDEAGNLTVLADGLFVVPDPN